MSKKFLRDLSATEHQLRKIAAVQASASMHTFIRTAINAHILRAQAAERCVPRVKRATCPLPWLKPRTNPPNRTG